MAHKNGSWADKKQSENIFENDFFKVVEDDVVSPVGKDSKIRHDRFPIRASPILPIDDDGYVHI